MSAVRLELLKICRLRLPLLVTGMAVAGVLFNSASMFSASTRASFDRPDAHIWESQLLSLVLGAAMLTPILVALVTSRIVDIEHTSHGWRLFHIAGTPAGALCRTKWLVAAGLLSVAWLVQWGGTLAVPWLLGMKAPPEWSAWLSFLVGGWGTTMALALLHIVLAARFESQLVGVGLGLVGGFLGVFTLLMPPQFALALPWGYYTVLAPYTFGSDGVVHSVTPMWGPWVLFCAVCLVVFLILTRHFDTLEG